MNQKPEPAPPWFPYLDHRTLAEVAEDDARREILDGLGR